MCTDALQHISQTTYTDVPLLPPHIHQSCQIDIEPPHTTPQSTLTDPTPTKDASTQPETDTLDLLEKKILTLTRDFSKTQNTLLTQNSSLKTENSTLQESLTHTLSQNSTLTQTLSQKTQSLSKAAQSLSLKDQEFQNLSKSKQALYTETLQLRDQISHKISHQKSLESKISQQISCSKIQAETAQKLDNLLQNAQNSLQKAHENLAQKNAEILTVKKGFEQAKIEFGKLSSESQGLKIDNEILRNK
jgi:exonuclease VII large subunit